MMEPRSYFENRIITFQQEVVKLEKLNRTVSVARIILFLIFLTAIVVLANNNMATGVFIMAVLFPVAFGLLINWHAKIRVELRRAENLKMINAEEINRLEHNFDGLDEGEEWVNRAHPYTYDLDIFGKNSIFQLINRSVTPSGRAILAGWLQQATNKKKIVRRQKAVAELAEDPEWTQELQAAGRMTSAGEKDLSALKTWLQTPPLFPGKGFMLAAYILPVVLICSILLTIFGYTSVYVPVILLVVNGFILRAFQKQVEDITFHTAGSARLLSTYSTVIRLIEGKKFNSDQLVKLKAVFEHDNYTASQQISRLGKLLDFLNSRSNLFFGILDLLFLIDIHLVRKAGNWKMNNQHDMIQWFDHIGKIEALSSLAGFSFSNPDFVKPGIKSPFYYKATNLGHPLIPPDQRVVNDFTMEGKGTVILITGSNMSGKSTFLRTIGVNSVLALAGSVVDASEFDIGELQVFTGMRSEDNLEENISSFYAELKRIRKLLDMISHSERPVFYMLDEVLKGTNTRDRHKGSEALLRRLLGGETFGLVSTHDLDLGEMADNYKEVYNYSFNSRIDNDEIIFDYTLQPGICRSFNASKLMEKLGILDDSERDSTK